MADLSDIQSAGSTKIIGSDATGLESTPVQATLTGNLKVADILDGSGVEGAITVSTTAVAARVGASNLTNRKFMQVYNNGTATIFWGYTSGVTTSTGTPLMRNQFIQGNFGPNTTIYLIATSGSHNVRITEGA